MKVNMMLASTEQQMAEELSVSRVRKLDNSSKLNKIFMQVVSQKSKKRDQSKQQATNVGSCYFTNSNEAIMRGFNPHTQSQEYFTQGNIQKEF